MFKNQLILVTTTLLFLLGIGSVSFGDDQVEKLIEVLKQDSPYSKMEAAKKLGKIKDVRAVEPLITALKDESLDVRWAASYALGEIGDKRAIEPLRQLLEKELVINIKNVIEEAVKKLTGELKPVQTNKKIIENREEDKTATVSQESNTESWKEIKLQPHTIMGISGTIEKLDRENKLMYIRVDTAPKGSILEMENTFIREQGGLAISWNDKTTVLLKKRCDIENGELKCKFVRKMAIENLNIGQHVNVKFFTGEGIQIINNQTVGKKEVNPVAKEITLQ